MPGFGIQVTDIDCILFRVRAHGAIQEVMAVWKEPGKAVRSLLQRKVEHGNRHSVPACSRDAEQSTIVIGRKYNHVVLAPGSARRKYTANAHRQNRPPV